MDDFIKSYDYHFTKEEENDLINDINNLLQNFESLLKLNIFNQNSSKILDASLICELMLNLIIKQKSFLLKNNADFSQIIIFCTNIMF